MCRWRRSLGGADVASSSASVAGRRRRDYDVVLRRHRPTHARRRHRRPPPPPTSSRRRCYVRPTPSPRRRQVGHRHAAHRPRRPPVTFPSAQRRPAPVGAAASAAGRGRGAQVRRRRRRRTPVRRARDRLGRILLASGRTARRRLDAGGRPAAARRQVPVLVVPAGVRVVRWRGRRVETVQPRLTTDRQRHVLAES